MWGHGKLIKHFLDQGDCFGVGELSFDLYSRQNEKRSEVLCPFVLILPRKNVKAIDLLIKLLHLLLLHFFL